MHLSWQRNLGTFDRWLRAIAGLLLVYLAIFQVVTASIGLNLLLAIVGIAMVIEGWLAY